MLPFKNANTFSIKAMDDGKRWAYDDENGNFEVLSSYYKVIKDYDKNDFLGASIIHGLKCGCMEINADEKG